MDPIAINLALREGLEGIEFEPPITHIYQPLDYAWEPFRLYLERYGTKKPREVILVGMNPGPWGMAQVGVPFGAVDYVRDWLQIEAPVGQPAHIHPKRPVEGFSCTRNEASGSRLWGWARERYGTAQAFFEKFFVYNYCPLLILEEGGKNRTPPTLRKAEREQVLPPCDQALRRTVAYFEPEFVIGIGAYAQERIEEALKPVDYKGVIGRVLHPSPASPRANRGWARQAEEELEALGVKL